MSDRTNDIRMYVEHLFEGRTLTPEAIELKEEIYGNLTARYEDYRAQGMSEDEAYARTCEAVTSVDGVLDGEGGEGGAVVGSGATSGAGGSGGSGATGGAGTTAVAPCPTGARPGDAPTAPGAPTPGTARGGLRGWKVAVAVAVVVFAVLVWVVAFGVSAGDGRGDSQDVTSAVVQPVGGGADDAAKGPDANAGAGSGGGGAADASPTAAGTSVISTDDVAREVASHDASALAGSVAASWPVESTSVSRLAGDLPLAGFVSSAGTDSNATYGNVVTVEYGWSVDERVARADGDVVESALAYDAAALLCAVPEADSVQLTVRETDRADGELDVDVYAFRRADVERALGVALTAERLTDGGWGDLRAQLSTERVYDQVVDHAERD